MTILLVSLAPVLIILVYIYIRDRYEREPAGVLAVSLLAGVVIVIPVIFVEQWLMALMPVLSRVGVASYQAFIVAAGTEELFKFLAIMFLIWRRPSFNEKIDGIVYAAFVSLGFAAVENILYVSQGGYQTALLRAITAVPAHALFGVAMGYYLGIARMYEELRRPYLFRAFLVPWFLHGIYDFILMVEVSWLLFLFVPFVVCLYLMGLRKIRLLSDTSVFRPPEGEDL